MLGKVGQENPNFEDQMEIPLLWNSWTPLLRRPLSATPLAGTLTLAFSLSFRTSCKYSGCSQPRASERPVSPAGNRWGTDSWAPHCKGAPVGTWTAGVCCGESVGSSRMITPLSSTPSPLHFQGEAGPRFHPEGLFYQPLSLTFIEVSGTRDSPSMKQEWSEVSCPRLHSLKVSLSNQKVGQVAAAPGADGQCAVHTPVWVG